MARPDPSRAAKLVIDTLRHMTEVEGKQPSEIFRDYTRWYDDHGENKKKVTYETVRKWAAEETTPVQVDSFYDFALTHEATPNLNNPAGKLAHAINTLLPSGSSGAIGTLQRLEGEFELIRRLWTPAGSDECLLCRVTFKAEHGVLIYRETSRFLSLYEVDETYTGYTFLFGSSFWILAHEKHRKSLKFLTIHETAPAITAASGAIEYCQGTLIAVSGRGPNESHRFVLRKKRGNPAYGMVSKTAAEGLFDSVTMDYLYNDNATDK